MHRALVSDLKKLRALRLVEIALERDDERENEPVVTEPIGAAPPHFSEQERQAWDLVRIAPQGVLTQADQIAVELLAYLVAELRQLKASLPAQKMVRLQALLGSFGMTAADRSNVKVIPPKTKGRLASLFDDE